jgi:hypothetical protein
MDDQLNNVVQVLQLVFQQNVNFNIILISFVYLYLSDPDLPSTHFLTSSNAQRLKHVRRVESAHLSPGSGAKTSTKNLRFLLCFSLSIHFQI